VAGREVRLAAAASTAALQGAVAHRGRRGRCRRVGAYYFGPGLWALASSLGGSSTAAAVQAGLWLLRPFAGATLPVV
jgi:hypothetical protein